MATAENTTMTSRLDHASRMRGRPSGQPAASPFPLLRAVVAGPILLALGIAPASAEEPTCSAQALRCCELPAEAMTAQAPIRFGVHVWPSRLAQSPASVERLLALSPGDLRFSLGPNWRRQPRLRPEMTDEELDALVAESFTATRELASHVAVMKRLAATGIRLHLIVWEPPSMPGEPDFNVAGARRWRVLNSSDVQLAARFQVANLRHIAALGLPLHAMELSNEPDGSWNIKIGPSDYIALVAAVRSEAARRKVALPLIYGPGASRALATRPFLAEPDKARELLRLVDVFSLHGWGDPAGTAWGEDLEALLQDLARLGPTPPIAVTEYGLTRIDPTRTEPNMTARNRVPDSVTTTPAYAGASLAAFFRVFRGRIGEVMYWEFEDQSWGRSLFGLLDVEAQPKPIYDIYRKVTQSIAELAPGGIGVAHDGRLAVLSGSGRRRAFVVNPSASPLDVVLPADRAPIGRANSCRAGPGEVGVQLPPGETLSIELAPRPMP